VKARHAAAYRSDARAYLARWNVSLGQDFHTLKRSQVDLILADADRERYKKPENANGSRARYFYSLIQRRAK
jgi:hypothetical protein